MRKIVSAAIMTALVLSTSVAANESATNASAAEVSAAPGDITIAFTAKVTDASSPQVADEAFGVKRGQKLTGTYTYNIDAVDENDSPNVGDYHFTTAPYGVTVMKSNKMIAQTDPARVDFTLEVVNNLGEPQQDNYLLRSRNNIGGPEMISWQLDDSGAKALQTDSLPTAPPRLTDWHSDFGFQLSASRSHVRAIVTEAVKL
jgi:hypothetical protein